MHLFAQGEVGYLFEDLPNDSIQKSSLRIHSSLKPQIRLPNNSKPFKISGLSDLHLFQRKNISFKTGAGIEMKGLVKNKFYYRISGIGGITRQHGFYKANTYIKERISDSSDFAYGDIRSRVSFTPNHIFNFQVGLDHNFIGEGCRSMLLSDYGTSYPFGQIRMNFWRIEYSILYQFLREFDNNRWEGKFASSHHISLNATKWLHFGVFESVIFQPKDTLLNRGFDAEYLNPFIFYRPQEYSLGSSDNVLLGVELSANWKEHMFYSQFMLDEFNLGELRKKTGWWANKFGGQLGFKGRFALGANKFFYRIEYNFARPYTYSHLSEELNYGNQGNPLAHPYGSNFMELLAEIKWQWKKMYVRLFSNYYLRGNDKDGFNYGGDIYNPYINRPSDYGHYIGQGQGFNGTKTVVMFGYELLEHGKLNAFLQHHLNYATLDSKLAYTFVIGLRSQLWNDYRNY